MHELASMSTLDALQNCINVSPLVRRTGKRSVDRNLYTELLYKQCRSMSRTETAAVND